MALVETGGRTPSAFSWHMQREGVQYGPYTDIQFRQMMAAGELLGSDSIWRDGMPQWTTLSELYPDAFPSDSPADALANVASSGTAFQTQYPRARPQGAKSGQFQLIATVISVVVVLPLLIYLGYVLFGRSKPPKPAAPPPAAPAPATKKSIFTE